MSVTTPAIVSINTIDAPTASQLQAHVIDPLIRQEFWTNITVDTADRITIQCADYILLSGQPMTRSQPAELSGVVKNAGLAAAIRTAAANIRLANVTAHTPHVDEQASRVIGQVLNSGISWNPPPQGKIDSRCMAGVPKR